MCLAVLFAFHGLESVAGAKVLLGCLADWFRQLAHFDLILRSQHLAVGVGNDIFHVPAADGGLEIIDYFTMLHLPVDFINCAARSEFLDGCARCL